MKGKSVLPRNPAPPCRMTVRQVASHRHPFEGHVFLIASTRCRFMRMSSGDSGMGRQVDARSARMVVMGVAAMRGASTVLTGVPVSYTGTGTPLEKNLKGGEPGAESGSPVRFPALVASENGRWAESDPRHM